MHFFKNILCTNIFQDDNSARIWANYNVIWKQYKTITIMYKLQLLQSCTNYKTPHITIKFILLDNGNQAPSQNQTCTNDAIIANYCSTVITTYAGQHPWHRRYHSALNICRHLITGTPLTSLPQKNLKLSWFDLRARGACFTSLDIKSTDSSARV